LLLFAWTIQRAIRRGESVVGIFNRRADAAVVTVLRGWRTALLRRLPVRS